MFKQSHIRLVQGRAALLATRSASLTCIHRHFLSVFWNINPLIPDFRALLIFSST
jgi:hypothetical protein